MNRPERTPLASGIAFAAGSYLLWGILPGYFVLIAATGTVVPTGPIELVAWRIVLSLVFCALLLTIVRGWGRFGTLLRDRRAMGWLAFASVVVAINWTVFVSAVFAGHVVEAALGYFINPIVTVLLGVVLLRERLHPLQWAAVGVSVVAVLVLAIGLGTVPWISLVLAGSFGLYGFAKNRVGPKADAIGGLAAETVILSPAAIAVLVVVGATTGISLGPNGPAHTALLLGAGAATAVPLILFAAGVRRIPLSYVGLLQYLAPVLQFVTGVFLLHEPMPLPRWIGFGIVWISLVLLAVDTLVHGARTRRGRVPDPTDGIAEIT